MTLLAFALGLVIGAALGLVLSAILFAAAAEDRRRLERMDEWRDGTDD